MKSIVMPLYIIVDIVHIIMINCFRYFRQYTLLKGHHWCLFKPQASASTAQLWVPITYSKLFNCYLNAMPNDTLLSMPCVVMNPISRYYWAEQSMSGKAGELLPTYRRKILPVAPSSPPSCPTRPARVARVPTEEGMQAMKKCKDTVDKMRAASKAERGGNTWTKTLAGVSGTWWIWHLVDKQWQVLADGLAKQVYKYCWRWYML